MVGTSSFLSDGQEKLTCSQRLYCFGIARAQRSSCHTDLSPFRRNDLWGGKDRELRSGDFDLSSGLLETPTNKRGRANFPAQEWWRTTRRASPTVLSTNCSSGYRDDSSKEQDRKLQRTAHPSDQLDRTPGSVETTANKQGKASFLAQERWRTSRRASPTGTFGICSFGSRTEDSGEHDRRRWRPSHPSGTSKRSLFPPLQVRSFFCTCWFGKEFGDFGSCCRQAVGEGKPLRRQGKSAEDERHATQELDQLSDDPLPPISDCATRQRDRCCFPRRGSIPRPIANRL